MSRRFAIAGVIAASLALAACGSSGPSTSASTEQSREQKFLQFTKCLREHGINVQTPTGGGGFKVRFRAGGNQQQFEAARNACKKYAPFDRPNLTPQQRVEREEAVRKFAKCMREHGIPLEAQTSNGGDAIGIHIGSGAGKPNPESPAFEAAQKACQSLLPKPPGGFPRGGPGPTTSSSGGSAGRGPVLGIGG
jgi:hypothetical protein